MDGLTAAIETLNLDVINLEKQQAGLTDVVSRMRRTLKVDDIEARATELQSRDVLTRAVQENTRLLAKYVKSQTPSMDDPGVVDLRAYYTMQDRRSRQAFERKQYAAWLHTLRQEIVPVCPCGKHRGVVFLSKLGQNEDPLAMKAFVEQKKAYGIVTKRIAGNSPDEDQYEITNEKNGATLTVSTADLWLVREVLCPEVWWMKQLRHALDSGCGSAFVDSYPKDAYVASLTI